jgi:hypothetical protein
MTTVATILSIVASAVCVSAVLIEWVRSKKP